MAASTALPPRLRISRPAAVASGWEEAHIPRLPKTGERREEKVNSFRLLNSNNFNARAFDGFANDPNRLIKLFGAFNQWVDFFAGNSHQ